jgi:hypothetical protein
MSNELADSVEFALKRGILSYNAKRWLFLERALIRLGEQGFKKIQQAIGNRNILEESKGKIEGFNIWAESYGVRLRAEAGKFGQAGHFKAGENGWVRYSEIPKTYIFEFRSRKFTEGPKTYQQELEKQVNRWKRSVLESEIPAEPEQMYHAEWLVLYQFEGMSHSQIIEWEDLRGNHYDISAVSKALKRAANYYYIQLRSANKGGRPRKNPRH